MTIQDFRKVTEAQFMQQVTDLADIYGWLWVHFRPGRTQYGWRTPVQGPLGKGWPDLFLIRIRDRRVMLVELKAEGAKVSMEQALVLRMLEDAGLDVRVWQPQDWPHIEAALRGEPS